jgi:hypothetical protein
LPKLNGGYPDDGHYRQQARDDRDGSQRTLGHAGFLLGHEHLDSLNVTAVTSIRSCQGLQAVQARGSKD